MAKEGKIIPLLDLLGQNEYVGILLGDGDWSDGAYTMTEEIVKKYNIDKSNTYETIYVGWSLYNADCNHAKVSSYFDFSVQEILDDVRNAMKNTAAGKVRPPMMITLHCSRALCVTNGGCETGGIPAVVSLDHGLGHLMNFGSEAFPLDDFTISKIKEREKTHIENLKAKLPNFEFLKASEANRNILVDKDLKGDNKCMNCFLNVVEYGIIGFYFSAHWCPPCQRFTPILVRCYEELKAAGKKFQVIFVSSDNNKQEFETYFNSMVTTDDDQFMAINFDQRQLRNNLSTIFDINGIPSLVLLKHDGSIISQDGIGLIASLGEKSYPWDDVPTLLGWI